MAAAMHPWLAEFIQHIDARQLPTATPAVGVLNDIELFDVFESQLWSRLLDLQSRLMQAQGQSFYTIGSSGHEANAAIAKALRVTDPPSCITAAGHFLFSGQSNYRVPPHCTIFSSALLHRRMTLFQQGDTKYSAVCS